MRVLKLLQRELLVGALFALPICAIADEVELSAPVRQLGTPPAAEPMNMPGRPAPPPPPQTLVRGLLPQYQATQAFRSDAAMMPDLEKSAVRFILALPDRLLLLEASVTINGRPYEMVRERRIDRLLAELKQPEPVHEEAVEVAVPTPEPAPEESPVEDESEEPTSDEAEAESEPQEPLIPVPSDALESRLRRYATVTGRPPTREEVRWLLTKWVDGPTLLLLDENFQRFRSTQAPAFYVLDRDMDGKVSAEELKTAQENLLSCDVNQNDVVEYTEIAEVADDPRRQTEAAPIQALIPILDPASVAKAFRRLVKEYGSPVAGMARIDANSDGQLDEAEFASLAKLEPDVAFTVSFDTKDVAKSMTRITHISTELGKDAARHVGSSITIPAGRAFVEISAVQSVGLSGSDQISVGVVNDGYPLLPALDPNEDGRLTIRELRRVVELLQRFDMNKDGELTRDEIPSTVRVAVGLGPSVHQHLADMRSVHPPSTTPVVPAPEWFVRMDGNKDGDISPREFLLGPENFKKLDADQDGLISPSEAVESIKDEAPAAKQETETKPEEA
ncbi:MAG: hypothetical protein ABI614_13815 [Planctomycetota bacterium]